MFRTTTLALALLLAAGFVQAQGLAVNTALSHLYGSGEIVEIFGRWFRQFGDPGPVIRAMYLIGTIPE